MHSHENDDDFVTATASALGCVMYIHLTVIFIMANAILIYLTYPIDPARCWIFNFAIENGRCQAAVFRCSHLKKFIIYIH